LNYGAVTPAKLGKKVNARHLQVGMITTVVNQSVNLMVGWLMAHLSWLIIQTST